MSEERIPVWDYQHCGGLPRGEDWLWVQNTQTTVKVSDIEAVVDARIAAQSHELGGSYNDLWRAIAEGMFKLATSKDEPQRLAGHPDLPRKDPLREAAEQAAADPDYDSDLWGDEAHRKWSVSLIAAVEELANGFHHVARGCPEACEKCRAVYDAHRKVSDLLDDTE